jgi:DNA-binding response OmpR family regulator
MNSLPRRILLVDDHQDTLDLFAMVLSDDNYEVVTASSLKQAWEQAQNRHFDLLVLDSRLQDGSGLELCRNIRETDQRTPILFCSGQAYEQNKQEALRAGAQAYLVKPVSIAAIRDAVHELISARMGDGADLTPTQLI